MKPKYRKKTIFWQDWGTYQGMMMVTCGFEDYEDIKRLLRKKKYREWLNALEKKPENIKSNHFSRWLVDDIHYQLLFLKKFDSTPEDYVILAHELVHAISFCMPDFLDPLEENEAFAYSHTFLMKSILKHLKANSLKE